MIQRCMVVVLISLVAACSTVEHNPTVHPYVINDELISTSPIKRVIIADVNLGMPSRKYLQESEGKIDGMVAAYLRENEFQVVSNRAFTQAWKKATRTNGEPFDPTTGRFNQKTFALNMLAVADEIGKSQRLDAIIFTDILEREIQFGSGLSRLARWDGVTRKPTLRGPGDGVSADFDWTQGASAASLMVTIYNMELKRVFTSVGGLDATDAIDTRSSSGRFTRRRNILENNSHLFEGVQLALHPFVVMDKYPGKTGS